MHEDCWNIDDNGDDGDDDGDDSDDGVCDDSPSSSIKVDKVIAGLDESPPVLNNDPTQRRHLVTFVFVSCSQSWHVLGLIFLPKLVVPILLTGFNEMFNEMLLTGKSLNSTRSRGLSGFKGVDLPVSAFATLLQRLRALLCLFMTFFMPPNFTQMRSLARSDILRQKIIISIFVES